MKIGEKKTNQKERQFVESRLLLEIQSLFHIFDKAMDINFEKRKF